MSDTTATDAINIVNKSTLVYSLKDYKCDICHKVFHFESTYDDHIKIHTIKRNFECYVCNKKFVKKSAFIQHLTTHSK